MPNVMTSHAYQTQRAAYLTHHATTATPCGICGTPIDYDLPGSHRQGPTIDHIQPRAHGCDPLDEANWRPAHRQCNSTRGGQLSVARATSTNLPSRRW